MNNEEVQDSQETKEIERTMSGTDKSKIDLLMRSVLVFSKKLDYYSAGLDALINSHIKFHQNFANILNGLSEIKTALKVQMPGVTEEHTDQTIENEQEKGKVVETSQEKFKLGVQKHRA